MKRALISLLRTACASLAAVSLTVLAGEIGALLLDMRSARLVGAGLALCVGAALAVSHPRLLKPAAWAAGLIAAVMIAPPLRLGRMAARWGIAGYCGALWLLFIFVAVALGGALACLPRPERLSRAASARRRNRAAGRSTP